MSNESVFDPATGKYGVWIDGEFVIDAKKRHEDDPNSIIKQEIKEEPGAADLCEIDGMDYETEFFDNREMMLPVFKIKSTEKVSVVNDGKEALRLLTTRKVAMMKITRLELLRRLHLSKNKYYFIYLQGECVCFQLSQL